MEFFTGFDSNNYSNITTASTEPSGDSASFCFHLPDAEFDKFHHRKTTNLVTGVLNAVLSPFAVAANFLIVFVILRRNSLQTPSNVLLTCLAVSDALVGLVVQPSFVGYRLLENAYGFVPCAVRMLYSTGFYACYGVSFMTLCAISCERFIALLYPFRYLELVRREVVIKTAVLIWVINILLTFLQWAHNDIARGIHLVLWFASLVTAVITQCRILPIIIRHQRQVKQYHSTLSQRQMQIKLAINIASIVAIYFAFNLPVLLVTKSHQIVLGHIDSYNFYSWAETAAFLNSSVNPLVCIWRVKAIRKAIRGIFTERSRPSRRKREKFGGIPNNDHGVFLVRFRQITVS